MWNLALYVHITASLNLATNFYVLFGSFINKGKPFQSFSETSRPWKLKNTLHPVYLDQIVPIQKGEDLKQPQWWSK